MTGYGNHAGFSITSSKIQLVEIVHKNSGFILQNVDEVFFDERLKITEDKETKAISVLQSAFNELLIRNRVISKEASFTLPSEVFYTVQLPYDNTLLSNDLMEEIKWELSLLYPYLFINDLAIRYIEIEKNSLVNFNTILISALKRKYLHWLKYFCNENKLKLKFIDNSHFASDRALTSLNDNKGIILSIYLSNKILSFIFYIDEKPTLFKNIPFTSANEIPRIILSEISSSESMILDKSMIDSFYISGEDISNSYVNTLNTSTGIDFKIFNPFEKVDPDPKLFENANFSRKFNSFSPAAGIAFRIA